MMNDSVPMYLDYLYLMDSVSNYASPKAKLSYMIKSGKIIKIRRGLYVRPGNSDLSLKTLANKIYGPSYISFEYALSYYGLIPERSYTITSASMEKNKSKIFRSPLGVFSYQSIHSAVFAYGVVRVEENDSPFLIATREKALCDKLSKAGRVTSIKSLETLLFNDLRIDRDALHSFNSSDVEFLAPLYEKKAIVLLLNYLKKEAGRA